MNDRGWSDGPTWMRAACMALVCSTVSACMGEASTHSHDSTTHDDDVDADSNAADDDGPGPGDNGGGDNNGDGGDGGNVIPGPTDGDWVNVTSNLVGLPSGCGTIPAVAVKPNENMLIVGVVTQGVFASTNSGASWTKLGSGEGSAIFSSGLAQIVFDPTDEDTWWLAGVRYGTPFKTTDNGATFVKLANFPQNDGIGVDFEDLTRKTILVGGHEQVREVQYSADGGTNWTNIGANLPADSGDSSYPYVVNASTFLVGTSRNHLYRTTDKGAHWTKVSDVGGGAYPLRHSDGSLYWAGRDTQGLVRSTDDGATWDVVTPGGVVYGMGPIELPDGRIAMRGPLGMLVTADQGANWEQVSPPVPNDYWWFQTTYNPHDRAFYTTRFGCDGSNVVNADALRRFAWDYE